MLLRCLAYMIKKLIQSGKVYMRKIVKYSETKYRSVITRNFDSIEKNLHIKI